GTPSVPARVSALADERRHRRAPRWVPASVAAGVALLVAGALGFAALTPGGSSNATNGHASAARAGAGIDRKAPNAAGKQAAPLDSGRDYTSASLAAGVRTLLGSVRPETSAGDTRIPVTASAYARALAPEFARLRAPAGLATCVAGLAGRPGVAPLAVDFASYQGRPAVLVVLPDRDPSRVQAWVVGPACTAGHQDLRHFEYVPRRG
ncbi:MAG: hypothetical protein M3042_11325, partial [Actinomycetota bacterium]|nr:hypothetical protein [Actinomycetota bacterium]